MSIRAICRASLIVAVAACALSCRPYAATAQDTARPVVLTEQQVQGFVAALPEIAALVLSKQLPPAPRTDPEMEAFAKKYGFVSFEQFAEVSAHINIVMAGFDPRTRAFTEPKIVMEQQIVELTEIRNQLAEELKTVPEIKSPIPAIDARLAVMKDDVKFIPVKTNEQNVRLVQKYFDQILAASKQTQQR